MSEYPVSKVNPSDKRSNSQVEKLLLSEGIRRDKNLDYTCAVYDGYRHRELFRKHIAVYGSQQLASG